MGGRRGQSTIYITVNKKLITDITNQAKTPHAIISADTSNCVDRVAHLIAVLVCSYFILLNEYAETFFTTIQSIRMYLLIAYRVSLSFYTDSEDSPF